MSIKWKYKIELRNKAVFKEIEEERNISFPKDLKDFVIEANAATPDKYKVMVGSDERVLGAVLSFNRDDEDVDTAFTAFEAINDVKLIPFAIDSFGNYFCYETDSKKIVFWNHENDKVTSSECDLKTFIDSLY